MARRSSAAVLAGMAALALVMALVGQACAQGASGKTGAGTSGAGTSGAGAAGAGTSGAGASGAGASGAGASGVQVPTGVVDNPKCASAAALKNDPNLAAFKQCAKGQASIPADCCAKVSTLKNFADCVNEPTWVNEANKYLMPATTVAKAKSCLAAGA